MLSGMTSFKNPNIPGEEWRDGRREADLHNHLVGQKITGIKYVVPSILQITLETGMDLIVIPAGGASDDMQSNIAATFYDISPETVLKAAQIRFGAEVTVTSPYWSDSNVMRFGIGLENWDICFGANFYFKEGMFH